MYKTLSGGNTHQMLASFNKALLLGMMGELARPAVLGLNYPFRPGPNPVRLPALPSAPAHLFILSLLVPESASPRLFFILSGLVQIFVKDAKSTPGPNGRAEGGEGGAPQSREHNGRKEGVSARRERVDASSIDSTGSTATINTATDRLTGGKATGPTIQRSNGRTVACSAATCPEVTKRSRAQLPFCLGTFNSPSLPLSLPLSVPSPRF